MFEVTRTDAFDSWLKGLKDSKGRTKIHARIDRLANANPSKTLYLLLCGGDKRSQDADIKNHTRCGENLNPPAKKE